jgi:hypothetical protein
MDSRGHCAMLGIVRRDMVELIRPASLAGKGHIYYPCACCAGETGRLKQSRPMKAMQYLSTSTSKLFRIIEQLYLYSDREISKPPSSSLTNTIRQEYAIDAMSSSLRAKDWHDEIVM